MIVTRDEILDAIDQMYELDSCGLCEAFTKGMPWWQSVESERVSKGLCRFLKATGGNGTHDTYFWPLDEVGDSQRLMFLAFMLTWHDELTGYTDD